MSDPIQRAKDFIEHQQAFRLGSLLTESFHPKTKFLSQTASTNLRTAISMLQSVDAEIPPAAKAAMESPVFNDLVGTLTAALNAGKRIYFTGCGATGRLAILLEAAWRQFWRTLEDQNPQIASKTPDLTDSVFSVMAGGDFALIKSVEGFEDFPDFGRHQLTEAGVSAGDVVVATTEGGETPFVIGTAWQGLDSGAEVFFVYNNPTALLAEHVERSRQVIAESRIRKLDLTTGPMAITGSTRMQAVTAELLVVGAALEMALANILQQTTNPAKLISLGIRSNTAQEYHYNFSSLLSRMSSPACVTSMGRLTQFEEGIYKRNGLVTYAADAFLLDILTDTTERSPTFMVPPFRKYDDAFAPDSWAFVKHPQLETPQAWCEILQRAPRGLEWTAETYRQMNAPEEMQATPPTLNNDEIFKFRIGNELDPYRTDRPDSVLVAVAVGSDGDPRGLRPMRKLVSGFESTAAIVIGNPRAVEHTETLFGFPCQLPPSPLQLWHHLAIKLIFNTVSTATMVRMGRVVGNAMAWLSPSNKKLIDRGSRLVSHLTGATYEQSCIALHQAIDEVASISKAGQAPPSPVALAIDHISADNPAS